MPTFRQLLEKHHTLLLIDSSSTRIQVALWRRGMEPRWFGGQGEAGEQLFAGVASLLGDAAVEMSAIDAFVYCDGPGSVLGIRTAAVALRTWCVLEPRPVYAFCGLRLVAHALVAENRRNFSVIADARRDSWHRVTVDAEAKVSILHRVPASALTGDLVMPEGFRHWSPLPASTRLTGYSLATHLPAVSDVELFDLAPEPDAFLHEEPVYQTWTPQVHRAPS